MASSTDDIWTNAILRSFLVAQNIYQSTKTSMDGYNTSYDLKIMAITKMLQRILTQATTEPQNMSHIQQIHTRSYYIPLFKNAMLVVVFSILY